MVCGTRELTGINKQTNLSTCWKKVPNVSQSPPPQTTALRLLFLGETGKIVLTNSCLFYISVCNFLKYAILNTLYLGSDQSEGIPTALSMLQSSLRFVEVLQIKPSMREINGEDYEHRNIKFRCCNKNIQKLIWLLCYEVTLNNRSLYLSQRLRHA